MLKIRHIDHIVLRVTDLPAMLAFYRDVLGCPIERVREDIGLYQLRAGSALIDLVPVDGELGRMGGAAPEAEGHNLDHLCLRVEQDLDQVADWLRAQQINFDAPARRYGAEGYGLSLYLRDPQGNTVELKGDSERSG